jgi:7-cyano-7-deazaguanine synthase
MITRSRRPSASNDLAVVLCSAGLDSAVLVAQEAKVRPVQPVYVSVGLAWEAIERRWLDRLMQQPPFDGHVQPPVELGFDMSDVYPSTHWAITGQPPAFDTPDEDVYIAGRNVVLLTKAGIYSAQHGVSRLSIGPLAGNPFPDATPTFFQTLASALSLGLNHSLEIDAPFLTLHKEDVIRLGVSLGVPLALTLSCMNPANDSHCGRCSKCRERHDAFVAAGVEDPTDYATVLPR